ncbi:GNAT family N-acetyltransferase [Methylocella silvestris]|uniref:GNAT family N-acetyltransferase n=1 Tax=Methylocella silvestris TaxID=199596 RepID=A0A2J7TL50_METSI|nr:GNAT family N-acetyltransferase [Methylocella silvestris]PNG27494.1 GNAT family N-acetyltransferase [Methylocella silvestris]
MFPDLTSDDIFRLETKRLWLRWPRANDAAAIKSFASLEETARMTAAIPHPYPAGEAERFIFKARADNANGRAMVLVISQKGEGRPVIGLTSATLADSGAIELGFLVSPSSWGKGYAPEAAQAHIEALFALTRAEYLCANARAHNPASRRVLEKCGFAYVDSGLDLLPARGGLHPCDRFRLSRKAWAARRLSPQLPPMVHQTPDSMLDHLTIAGG